MDRNPQDDPPSDDELSDHSDAPSDSASSGIVEMEPSDFPASFREWGGRLFHSHGRSPYPLPVDADEQHRLNRQHVMFRDITGWPGMGPVHDVLVDLPGPRRNVVDLGTGTGRWVTDMARLFPHVDFHGYDIAPIQTRHPPDNVWFVMYDITEKIILHEDHTVDMVHARDIALGMTRLNYDKVLRESARILRRGGLLVVGEWHRFPFMADGRALSVGAPHTHALFHAIDQALSALGLSNFARHLREWLDHTGKFENSESRIYSVQVGGSHPDRERPRAFREMLRVFVESMRWPLMRRGYSEVDINAMRGNCLGELEMTPGVMCTFYAVHARRR